MSFYMTVRALFHPVGRAYFRMRVEGLAHIPRHGPAILAANHASWLDPIILGSACPRPIRFLIARSVYEKRAARWFYSQMRTIPVEMGSRDRRWLRSALTALREGELVGVFPEGVGLSHERTGREPRAGALMLGALSGAPFVPVGLRGTSRAWPPSRLIPRPCAVSVRFGEPFAPWTVGSKPRADEFRSSISALMERIQALLAGGPA